MKRDNPERTAALLSGELFYYTGRPCKYGHPNKRRVKDRCCYECQRLKAQKAYYKNPRSAYNKEWQARNRARRMQEKRAWNLKMRAHTAQYSKRYIQENREKVNACHRNRRYRLKKAGGRHSARDIDRLYILQNGKCNACSRDFSEVRYHVDHMIPIANGGSNWPHNLELLCQRCNSSKRHKDPLEWARQVDVAIPA